ncbi:ABC transporter permease, partial [Pseudomonas syringae pv. tagetis]
MFEFSPQTRRRFDLFSANRRGWWSLWIFIGLMLICLCGELIANDMRLLIRYDGQLYFPVLH